jgi:sodium/hydrogen exchanger 8
MAILFCGITMSHYTHFNLSPMTQITMQQTFRTLSFVAGITLLMITIYLLETCTFAYLGMALFTFPLSWDPVFIIWSIVLCLVGRALNIFPLSFVVNSFRKQQISRKYQFVMWFSGMLISIRTNRYFQDIYIKYFQDYVVLLHLHLHYI